MASLSKLQQLKILLIKNNVVLSRLARELNCTRQNVYCVLAGRYTSTRVIAAVAEAVGMEADDFRNKYIPKKAA